MEDKQTDDPLKSTAGIPAFCMNSLHAVLSVIASVFPVNHGLGQGCGALARNDDLNPADSTRRSRAARESIPRPSYALPDRFQSASLSREGTWRSSDSGSCGLCLPPRWITEPSDAVVAHRCRALQPLVIAMRQAPHLVWRFRKVLAIGSAVSRHGARQL